MAKKETPQYKSREPTGGDVPILFTVGEIARCLHYDIWTGGLVKVKEVMYLDTGYKAPICRVTLDRKNSPNRGQGLKEIPTAEVDGTKGKIVSQKWLEKVTFCPRCEKGYLNTKDYLCWECRYG